jgi:hypothetical protein
MGSHACACAHVCEFKVIDLTVVVVVVVAAAAGFQE